MLARAYSLPLQMKPNKKRGHILFQKFIKIRGNAMFHEKKTADPRRSPMPNVCQQLGWSVTRLVSPTRMVSHQAGVTVTN